ncbi:hypothetical protein [Cylindrospermum sp. FACHB-282]|uniref:hypothetical protein n=1 Tax=Cylindrospermum sp. FACHB-282 TaxID=2692794 RepID=UPI0016892877|nr:hypothetical protein [Cylindrospermum sp. FACHB-282]MBD2386010.1 hypothetical protein [Cylindrospermum sp. FACHB-282]
MSIKFVKKFGSRLPPEEPKKISDIFAKLNQEHQDNVKHIQPHLKDLFGLYDDRCVIFDGNNYVGQNGYSFRGGKIEDYDQVGKILAQM